MRLKVILLVCATLGFGVSAGAQDITGTILIKKKLTKPSVTAAVSVYQRGTAVKLGKDNDEDPIAYERSRVVIYIEGPGPSIEGDEGSIPQVQQLDRRFAPDLVVVP